MASSRGRPGPQPLSARQTMNVNAQNARDKREIEQVVSPNASGK